MNLPAAPTPFPRAPIARLTRSGLTVVQCPYCTREHAHAAHPDEDQPVRISHCATLDLHAAGITHGGSYLIVPKENNAS